MNGVILMDNLILFNPGDSIGNFHDYDEAVRTAQIYRESNQIQDGHVLVVKGVNKTSFDVFLADNEITHLKEQTKQQNASKEYQITKKI